MSRFEQNTEQDGEEIKTVFISYSWDNEEHKFWVLNFAHTLMDMRVNVIIDEWSLVDYEDDMKYFMEKGIEQADYVLIICTPNYKERADERKGNVGVESVIITGDFYMKGHKRKYIPVIRSGADKHSIPRYLLNKKYYDFRNGILYEKNIEELWRRIYERPIIKRPELGTMPEFETLDLKNILEKRQNKFQKEDFTIIEPEEEVVHKEWIMIGGRGCPPNHSVFLINELKIPGGSNFWLQPDFAAPDRNGNWMHRRCNTKAVNTYRNVYGLAVPTNNINKIKETFLERTTGYSVIRGSTIERIRGLLDAQIRDYLLTPPKKIIRK